MKVMTDLTRHDAFFQRRRPVSLRCIQILVLIFSTGAMGLLSEPASAAAIDAKAPTQRVIVLDPGHGGSGGSVKTGASQEGDGASWNNAASSQLHLLEKNLTLSYCKAIAQRIESSPEGKKGDWRVILTRSKDQHLSAMERAAVAVRESADIFVSVHFNSGKKASGTRIYYVPKDHPGWEYYHFLNPYAVRDRRFSRILRDNVATALTPYSGTKSEDDPRKDNEDPRIDGIRMLGYARQDTHLHNCAVALIEIEFIDNPTVEKWLLSDGNQAKTEKAVANSFVESFRTWFSLPPGQRMIGTQSKKARE